MARPAKRLLQSLLRAGQRQTKAMQKVVKAVLAPPMATASKPAKRRSTAKSAVSVTGASASRRAATSSVASSGAGRVASVARVCMPALPKAPGQWLPFQHVGVLPTGLAQLNYWLYLPTSLAEPGPVPLIVMLHGCEQTAASFAQGTRMNAHAERSGCAVLYPQQALSSHARRCWRWYERATQQGGGDAALVLGAIDAVLARYPVDPQRVTVAGLSAGAGLAHILALHHPQRFAGVGLHSGPVFGAANGAAGALAVMRRGASGCEEAIDPLRAQAGPMDLPTILVYGTDDPVVGRANLDGLVRQALRWNGLSGQAPTMQRVLAGTRAQHPCVIRDWHAGASPAGRVQGGSALAAAKEGRRAGRKLLLRVVEVAELRHAWSGGDGSQAWHCGSGPDASRLLLDFLLRQRRR